MGINEKELLDSFYKLFSETDTCFGYCENEVNNGNCSGTGHGCGLWKIKAKECASIAVKQMDKERDERIKELETFLKEEIIDNVRYYDSPLWSEATKFLKGKSE